VKNQLIEEIGRVRDKIHFMRMIDQIVSLSELYDDEVINALCYMITVTKDWDVRFRALTVIDKIKGR